ncbi:MAG: cytochrome o ubiquinol oxidase subunit IV, partial [Pseudomonas sp.]
MANAHNSHAAGNHGSAKSYGIGFVLSVILTIIPFGLVMYPSLPKEMTLWIIVAFAAIQVLVHLVYFLHLDRSAAQRNNVIAFVFAAIVIVLLVGLSLW